MSSQHLSNLSWSFAKLLWVDWPLLDAISAAAIPTISAYDCQGLVNTAWAMGRLSIGNVRLMRASTSRYASITKHMRAQDLSSSVWALAASVVVHEPFL